MILMPTTTIALLGVVQDDSPEDDDDWGGAPDPTTGYGVVASGIRAHLSAPSAAAASAQEGNTTRVQFRLLADPCDIVDNMRIRDEQTGEEYQVDWSLTRPEPLSHVIAGVSKATSTA